MKAKIDLSNAADTYYNQGLNYAADTYFAKGLEDFRILLEKDPSNPETYSQLGIHFIKCENYVDAIIAIREAIRLSPQSPEYYMHAGVAYYKQGNYLQAIKLFRKATSLKRDYVEVYFRLAHCYEMLNDPELIHKACAAYRQYLYYQPNEVVAMVALGTTYGMAGRYDQSIATFERAEELCLDDPFLNYNKGNSYYHKGNYMKAMMAYEKALELLPEFEQAQTNLELARKAFRNRGK
ncbi:MAG: tetratricopeptide repeat protein [Tannerellaceae bacterium]|jgi:Flp pilus assembly protein TadD|nr:tetratricopeptide repeat protein [Tannerellaceae bacterium]